MAQPIPRIITLQALTFLHPGTGQSTGAVDLPIQREVHSRHPMFASSGFKGALRNKAEQQWNPNGPEVNVLFGRKADDDGGTLAGSISVTDGRILAFPVRSLQQVFVWITCPMVIKRLVRDAQLVNLDCGDLTAATINEPVEDRLFIHPESSFTSPLVLEEMLFTTEQKGAVKKTGETILNMTGDNGFDPKRLVMVTDEDFTYFVEHATQVAARIQLNEKKTTTGGVGNLWYEETLPPETVFYGFILCHAPRNGGEGLATREQVSEKLTELLNDHYLQIGGNETVGQGWCHVHLTGEVVS